jgi:hypothetical protein
MPIDPRPEFEDVAIKVRLAMRALMAPFEHEDQAFANSLAQFYDRVLEMNASQFDDLNTRRSFLTIKNIVAGISDLKDNVACLAKAASLSAEERYLYSKAVYDLASDLRRLADGEL